MFKPVYANQAIGDTPIASCSVNNTLYRLVPNLLR